MNILIISFDADPPYMGGVSTMTNLLAKHFIAKGHFCALGYFDDEKKPSSFFKYKIKISELNKKNVEVFLIAHNINIILNQIPSKTNFKFLNSVISVNCKIATVYHSRPMLHFQLFEILLRILNEKYSVLYKIYTFLKIPLIPIYFIITRTKELNNFNDINLYSDKIILLSKNFFPNWKKLVSNANDSKLTAINNPLVYPSTFNFKELNEKEKLVIVIYSNPAKRANVLLQIWNEIENDASFYDWNFEFIGEGEGYSQILNLAKKLNLKRITFTGYQNPYSYYQRASIMMMTSKYEGWPMVLMEGQQMGVVPIVYNSFESLTDIINDGVNGIIIPNNNIKLFVEKLKNLMQNTSERHMMAENAIMNSKRFNIDEVVNKYLNLFHNLVEKK